MAAVSLDTVSSAKNSTSGANTLSWSHTVGASANGLLVSLAGMATGTGNRFASSVKYNNVALSSLSSLGNNNSSVTAQEELWFLANPTTGANTVSVTFGDVVRADGFAASFLNVSGTSATGATSGATGTSTTGTVVGIQANGSSDYLVAGLACSDGATGMSLSGPLLSIWTTQGNGSAFAVGGLDTNQASATSSTLTVGLSNSRPWSMIGVALLAASAPPAGPTGGGAYFYRRSRGLH